MKINLKKKITPFSNWVFQDRLFYQVMYGFLSLASFLVIFLIFYYSNEVIINLSKIEFTLLLMIGIPTFLFCAITGILMIIGCIIPPDTRWGKQNRKYIDSIDIKDTNWELIIIIFPFTVLAFFVTVFLRILGIKGYQNINSES